MPAIEIERGRLLLPWLLALGAACGGGAEDSTRVGASPVAVRDSAGIHIVESRAPTWEDGEGLVVDSEPSLVIGRDEATELYGVVGAIRLGDGRIVVANGGTREVLVFGPDGRPAGSIGRPGEGPGEFMWVTGVLPHAADSVVVEDQAGRISIFGPDGGFGRQLRSSGPDRRVAGITPAGNVLLTAVRRAPGPLTPDERYPRHILLENGAPDGTVDTVFAREAPEGLFTLVDGRVVVPEFHPSAALAARGNRVVVGRSDRWEFVAIDLAGTTRRIARRIVEPTPVTDEIVDRHLTGMITTVDPDTAARQRAAALALPPAPVLPAWQTFALDRLWVRPFHVGEVLAGSARAAPFGRASASRGPVSYAVFDPEGVFLGDVEVPAGVRPLDVGRDWLLGAWRDELDLEYVGLFRLRMRAG